MRKRNIMVLIILLAIGFAAITTTLYINGTIKLGPDESDFDVIFTEATINGEGSTVSIDEETNIQSSRALGYKDGVTTYATVQFANDDKYGEQLNSYTGSIVEEYVNNYVGILKT